MKTYFYKRLKPQLPLLSEKVKTAYGENLLAIVIYGSLARGDFSQHSDIDLLVVLNTTQISARRRILDFYERVGDDFEGHLLSPLILPKDALKEFHPFFLGLLQGVDVLYDRANVIDGLVQLVNSKRQCNEVIERKLGDSTYWVIRR